MQFFTLSIAVLAAFAQAAPSQVKRDTGITESSLGLNPAGWFERYGYPGPIPQDNLLVREEYITAPNYFTRNPYWSVEHISKDSIKIESGVTRDHSAFKEDTSVPQIFRSTLADYKRSGYDRGHQAPAGDVQFSQSALDQTFYLSNMCPQQGVGFNRNYWAWTEEFARTMTQHYDSVRILTGPLYIPTEQNGSYEMQYKVIGENGNVHVPTHFFKVVVGETNGSNTGDAAAFVLPNVEISDSTPLTQFQVSYEQLSKYAGMNILYQVTEGVTLNNLCDKVTCQAVKYSHDRYNSQV